MPVQRQPQTIHFLLVATILAAGCGVEQPPPAVTEIRIAIPANGESGPISRPFYVWKEKWEAESGAKLTLVEIPPADLPERVALAFQSSDGKLDGAVVPAWFDGELLSANLVVPIHELKQSKDFPPWSEESLSPSLQRLLRWGDSWTSCPFTADSIVLFYRKDVLNNPKHREAYEKKSGEPLREPQSWDDLEAICKFFDGVDWNGDGKSGEHGVSLSLGPGSAGDLYVALSAAYVVQPGPPGAKGGNVFYFDPETMAPLVESSGHVKGLDVLRRLAKFGDPKQPTWRSQDAWADFLAGRSLFCITTPDLGRRAQDSADSTVKGKLGCQVLPGAKELWSFKDKRFKTLSKPNVVGNTVGDNWHGVIARTTSHPGLVYHLFAYQANRLVNAVNVVDNRSGVHISRSFNFTPPHGEASSAEYEKGGFDPSDLKEISGALFENFYRAPTTLEPLRLPGAAKLKAAIEDSLQEAFANPSIPSEAILKGAADKFQKTMHDVEIKLGEERLKDAYRQSLGEKPKAAP